MDTSVEIKLEPSDEILAPQIKIEPDSQNFVAPVINPRRLSYSIVEKKRNLTTRKPVLQKCCLCDHVYEIVKPNLKCEEIKSFCLVLGICTPNRSFEKLIQKDFEICESCTNLFKQIHKEYTVLSEADRKIKECVKIFRQRLSDRQVSAAHPADLGRT